MSTDRARIGVVYFDGGTAHRSASFALVEAINRTGAARAEVVDAMEVFAYDRPFHAIVRRGVALFNFGLRTERVFALSFFQRLGTLVCDLQSTDAAVERMSRYFAGEGRGYDVLISTIPIYNETLFRSLRVVRPDALGMVLPVDFEEHLPRYWFSPRAKAQHYLCFNDRLFQQARAHVPDAHVHRLSGLVVHPDCYLDDPERRAREREQLGLPVDRPIGLVSFGGQGSSLMVPIARELDRVGRELSCVHVCGRDEATFRALSTMTTKHQKLVLPFTRDMPRLLRAADFFIGKPGPVSIHEALVTATPSILFKSRGMRPILGPNERWVEEQRLGIVIPGADEVSTAVRRILDDPGYAQRAERAFHRGVFEAVDLVLRVCGERPRAQAEPYA